MQVASLVQAIAGLAQFVDLANLSEESKNTIAPRNPFSYCAVFDKMNTIQQSGL